MCLVRNGKGGGADITHRRFQPCVFSQLQPSGAEGLLAGILSCRCDFAGSADTQSIRRNGAVIAAAAESRSRYRQRAIANEVHILYLDRRTAVRCNNIIANQADGQINGIIFRINTRLHRILFRLHIGIFQVQHTGIRIKGDGSIPFNIRTVLCGYFVAVNINRRWDNAFLYQLTQFTFHRALAVRAGNRTVNTLALILCRQNISVLRRSGNLCFGIIICNTIPCIGQCANSIRISKFCCNHRTNAERAGQCDRARQRLLAVRTED